MDDWLRCLRITVQVQELNRANLQRATQLLNKTTQMNLTTRRMTADELDRWANEANHRLWTFSVFDKIGASGLTGILSLEVEDRVGRIVDFVLSCRVMGRKVEEAMIYTAVTRAKDAGVDRVCAELIPTPKNTPCLHFLKRCGFVEQRENVFVWQVSRLSLAHSSSPLPMLGWGDIRATLLYVFSWLTVRIIPEVHWSSAARWLTVFDRFRRENPQRYQRYLAGYRAVHGAEVPEREIRALFKRAQVDERRSLLCVTASRRKHAWNPEVKLAGRERLIEALSRGRGAILWFDNLPLGLVGKMALAQARQQM
jgi:hypothetical protein